MGKLRDKLSSNNVINKEILGGVSPSTELISNGAEEGSERKELFINHDNGYESKRSDSDSVMKEAEETNSVCSADVFVPLLPPKSRSNSGKTRPPVPPRKDLNEGTGGDGNVFPGADSQNEGQQLVSDDPCPAVTDPTKKTPKRAPIKPPRRTILRPPSESGQDKTPDTPAQGTAITCLPTSDDIDPFNYKDEGSFNMTANDNAKTSKDQRVKESSSNGNIGADTSFYSCPIEPKRPAPMVPVRSVSKKPIPVPRTKGKLEEGANLAPVPASRSKANDENEEFSPESNVASPPRTNSFSFPEDDKTAKKSSTLPRSFPLSPRTEPYPLPSRETSASLKIRRGLPNIPLPPLPCDEHNEKSRDKLTEVHQQEEECEESTYEAVNQETEPKIDEAACYASDDSSADSLDDLSEADFSSKFKRTESTDGVDDHRISKNILSPRVRKRDGWLWKQGGPKNNKGWKKRWFVFNGTDLRYYKENNSLSDSLHIIPVIQMKNIEHVKEAKRPTFKVITPNRLFLLVSSSTTDMNLWSQTLMEAIITTKRENEYWKKGGDMADPDKQGLLKKQGHNMVADWKTRYVAVKDDKICYYESYEDFIYATPINCINAALAKVKPVEGHKNRFVIITVNKNYMFQAENEFEAAAWMVAIETAIQIGLGDRYFLEQVQKNPSNLFCADCGMKDPVWASVNFCVCVCALCIGVHRSLGVHCSRARSLLMDEKIWNPTLVELMIKIGNDKANQLLEHKMPEDDKISPSVDSAARREFIYSKYYEKKYCKYHQAFGNADVLGKFLRDTVVTDDVFTTMELILNKVDVQYVPQDSEDEKSPLELAEEAGQSLQAELLRQNGGEGKFEMLTSVDTPITFENNQTVSAVAEVIYEKEGFLYKKEATWRKKWFLLKDRQLKYARGPHERDDLAAIDLTTVTSLVKCSRGESFQMDIVTPDKTHSLKADTEEELEAWYLALRNKQVFGVLLSYQDLGSDGIPHLVAKCLHFVETYGGLELEGVYRVNGSQLSMKALRTAFDQDAGRVLLTLDMCGVHDATGVLKQYLRELPDPVIPGHMYKAFITAALNQDHNTRLTALKDMISQLPKVNHDTLKIIIFHLTKVVELSTINKMGVPNVAMIFGPTLMSNSKTGAMDDASINQEFSIVGDMISYYQWLFDVGEEEFLKDQAMKEAKEKIRKLNDGTENVGGGEFTLDIYVRERNESPCRMKVSSEMTAGRVCAEIVSQMDLSRHVDWVLFEVISNGAMERAFQVREKVLAAAKWGPDNYLIVKENYIAEQIAPHVGGLSIDGTIYIREPKKNWKQSPVCLKNGYLTVSKEKGLISKATKEEQWPLHKLTLYLGIPPEKATKGIDTSCGFTVNIKTDQDEITRYFCVRDRREKHRWVAAILNMKHPEGIWCDPSHRETGAATSLSEAKAQPADDLPMYLGRQSTVLRRKDSSKNIIEELRFKRKSLKRSGVGDHRK